MASLKDIEDIAQVKNQARESSHAALRVGIKTEIKDLMLSFVCPAQRDVLLAKNWNGSNPRTRRFRSDLVQVRFSSRSC
jgi:hypothetical protein